MAESDGTLSEAEAVDTIWKLAKSIDFCMFVTWDGKRQRARPLSARPDRDASRIYFLTDVRRQGRADRALPQGHHGLGGHP